jgi:predicted  nucleic acid-binding Zn-ribbon protein
LNDMAKRSTIGENPLDALVQENPLDTVVPDLSVVARSGRGQPNAEALSEVQERLAALEAGFKTLKSEVMAGYTAATTAAASLKGAVGGVQEELARLRKEIEQIKAEAPAGQALAAQMAQLKEELAKVRSSAAPGDLPFWMRGKKK